jgi:hypothetical protein
MNNEFIVWDERLKEFLEPMTIEQLAISMPVNKKFLFDWNIFPYIGKTDDTPEQNKIYAGTSIVEFDFLEELHNTIKLCGIFTFNIDELRYEINLDEKVYEYSCLSYNDTFMSNFKVIGTIQENPELLGEQ